MQLHGHGAPQSYLDANGREMVYPTPVSLYVYAYLDVSLSLSLLHTPRTVSLSLSHTQSVTPTKIALMCVDS